MSSTSLGRTRLHQKYKVTRWFNFQHWRGSLLFSEHLRFLSFQIVHQMHVGTIFHLSLWHDFLPSLFQLARTSDVSLGITQLIPPKLKNICHSVSVTLHCMKRWFVVSISSSQKKHLDHNRLPHLHYVYLNHFSTSSSAHYEVSPKPLRATFPKVSPFCCWCM